MKLIDLHLIDYKKAWDFQKQLFSEALDFKKSGEVIENKLILCEHNPVYTLGKSGKEENLLISKEFLGVDIYRIERGGDITFHGPGQLVAYPIFDLEIFNLGVKDFIYKIEAVIINTLARYSIIAGRDEKNAGVWLDVGTKNQRKIAALGFKLSRFVSMHGLALNVNTDLTWFTKMIPCGLQGLGVTSLEKELSSKQDLEEIKEILKREFEREFNEKFLI